MPAALPIPNRAALLAGVLAVLLSACGPAAIPPGDSIVDRDETRNRANHEFNRGLDRVLVGPASNAYGTVIPAPVRTGVSNFATNLNQPSYVLNNLLQFRLGQAMQNTARFAINSTIGIGGLFDPATAMGVPAAETDFGETLHIYGVPEGAYTELPVFGPSTSRDAVGLFVDMAMNPVRVFLDTPESRYVTGAEVLARFNDRYTLDDTIDSILYESADSYTQLRSIYLQTRRFELGGSSNLELGFDPELGGDASQSGDIYTDPYSDPYIDPYAQ